MIFGGDEGRVEGGMDAMVIFWGEVEDDKFSIEE